MNDFEEKFLARAIALAKKSVAQGGFPAGAVVVRSGEIIGEGVSIGNILNDPTSHGETAAIRDACKNLKSTELKDCVLYSSMEPCVMCLGAAVWALVSKIVYAVPRENVSPEYYGGIYNTSEISKYLLRPPVLIHGEALEEDSMAVVREWEVMQRSLIG